MLDKNLIIKELKQIFSNDLIHAKEAHAATQALMSQDDLKQEGKYDTRRIEASYLAGAQLKRIEEIQIDLEKLDGLTIIKDSKNVVISSLVHCSRNDTEDLIFITPTTGGFHITIDNQKIHIVSNTSPLGEEIITMEENDIFELTTPKGVVEYEILRIN